MKGWGRIALLFVLAVLAVVSLGYGARTALRDGADLERRAEEVRLFRNGSDPYTDPDMTYPPTSPPVFTALVPIGSSAVRRVTWIVMNFIAAGVLAVAVVMTWGREWPGWVRIAFVLTVAACKPTRAGIALGQFHLIPTALVVLAEAASRRVAVCGVLTGLALVKPTMSAPYVLMLAARRRWGALGIAFSVQAVLLAITCGWLRVGPVTLIREWLGVARSQMAEGTLDVPSLLGRALPGWPGVGPIASAVVLAMTGFAAYTFRRKSSLGLLALATFSAAVVTYHRHYDLVLLLPTLAYLIREAVRGADLRGGAVAVAFGAILIVPSDRRLFGAAEDLYNVFFVIASYAVLSYLVWRLFRESDAQENARDLGSPS